MPSTTAYRQGDIVLVSFPFTDLTSSKRRPALIISPDSFNAAGQDLVLAAITSHITDDPNAIQLSGAYFAQGELPKKSIVKTTKLFTMHASLVVKKVCTLKREDGRSSAVSARILFVSEMRFQALLDSTGKIGCRTFSHLILVWRGW